MDEERRLFYVVVTRAKDSLHLFAPQMRRTSDGGMYPVELSMFLKEIPSELVNVRRVQSYPDAYAGLHSRGGQSGYGRSSSGYGYGAQQGGLSPFRRGGGGSGGRTPPPVYKTTWRR